MLDPNIPYYSDELQFAANFGRLKSDHKYETKELTEDDGVKLFLVGCAKFNDKKSYYYDIIPSVYSRKLNIRKLCDEFDTIASYLGLLLVKPKLYKNI